MATISNSDQEKVLLVSEKIRELDEQYPSLHFIPNIGQEKALSFFLTYHGSPYIMLFGGGNGVGKTALLANFANGLIFGPDYMDDFFQPYKVFEEFQQHCIDRQRRGHIRIVVHADSMKESGSVYQAISEWFPRGPDPRKPFYKLLKGGKTYYSEIQINMPFAPTVEIKTHDQDATAHAGTTVDWILFDEPFPQGLWTESIGRTRDGGRIAMFMTPLNMAGWLLDDVVDQVDGVDICMTNASIWDNCADIPGTRGRLQKKNIERMIKQWQQNDPNEVEARVNGTFTHLKGSLYKNYTEEIHAIEPFKLPEDWPIYLIIDPHDSKTPAVTWIMQGPDNQHWVIKEYPDEDYTKLGNTNLTIMKQINLLKEIEGPFDHQIVRRIMDPNKGTFVYSTSKLTIQDEWRNAGMRTDLCKIDDLDVGHKAVQRLLWFDQTKPSYPGYNQPSLKVFNTCKNTMKALSRYGFKKKHDPGASLTSKIDKTYKDFADNLRYYAVTFRDFQPVSDSRNFVSKLYAGRIPVKHK